MKSKGLLIFILILLVSCGVKQTGRIDESPKNHIEAKIDAMTLEEKIEFIGGYEEFNIMPVERLGIPEIHFADGPVGIRNFGKSTAYPATIALAASFDKEMAYNVGKAIGSESRAKNCHVMLGPAMNIYRLPICGRNFEYMGEDPYLAGQLSKMKALWPAPNIMWPTTRNTTVIMSVPIWMREHSMKFIYLLSRPRCKRVMLAPL